MNANTLNGLLDFFIFLKNLILIHLHKTRMPFQTLQLENLEVSKKETISSRCVEISLKGGIFHAAPCSWP